LKSRRLASSTCEVNHVHRRPHPRGVRDADPVNDLAARHRVQVEGHGKNPGGIEWLTAPTERLASTGQCDTAEMFAALAPNGGETGTAKYKSALAMPPVVGAWRESSGVQRRSDGNLKSTDQRGRAAATGSEGWVSGGDERGMGERRGLKCRFPLLTVVISSSLIQAAMQFCYARELSTIRCGNSSTRPLEPPALLA
jgi:hypothetical protein